MLRQRLIRDIIRNSYCSLWSGSDQFADIHILSQIRLRRNHAIIPFKDTMSDEDRIHLLSDIQTFAEKEGKNFEYFPPSSFEKSDILLLEEKEILQNNEIPDGFVFSGDDISISVNGMHHIEIIASSGLCGFEQPMNRAMIISDIINKYIPFAFTSDYGFLFSNPLDTGSGLQITSLLHIPSLSMLKCFPEVRKIADELEIDVSPYHEQGVHPLFCILSSKNISDSNESDTAGRMKKAIEMISDIERDAREEYYYEFEPQIDDAVWRSFGVLSHSRMISYREAFEYLSNIRLGLILSIIKGHSLSSINELLFLIKRNHVLAYTMAGDSTQLEADRARAQLIRNYFSLEIPDA